MERSDRGMAGFGLGGRGHELHGRPSAHTSALDDAELLRGAAAGDWRCVAALYDRHRDGSLAVATSVLADPSEAEDVVHDAFVDLPRMARSYDPRRGRLTQWLYRSIRNRAIDHVRRRSRLVSRMAPSIDGPEALLEMTPQRGPSPIDEAEAQEILDLVARLDGRNAHLIRLAFVDGWSHTAIARMTGLPLGTVKTRIRNSLRQLRTLMAEPDLAAFVSTEAASSADAVIVVCTRDRRLVRAVSAYAAGLARIEALDDLPGRGWWPPAAVVLDLRSTTMTSAEALDQVADAGWQNVPTVLLPAANEPEGLPTRRSLVFAIDSADPRLLELESAVPAALSAAMDPALRDAATDRLLRQDGPAIVIGDRLGRIRGATPAAALLFGRSPRQLAGSFLTDLSAMPREWTERQWQHLASTGCWAGRTLARRPAAPPLQIWGRVWMPPGGGFVAAYAPVASSSAVRGAVPAIARRNGRRRARASVDASGQAAAVGG